MPEMKFMPDRVRVSGEEDEEAAKKKAIVPPEQKKSLEAAREKHAEFSARHQKTIEGYLGTKRLPFSCEPGGWYFDFANLKINADPTFFLEKGYTESEALFATFHEAEHFLDMVEDPDIFERLSRHSQAKKRVHPAYPKTLMRFYNCLDDIVVNKKVMQRWSAGSRAKDSLYPKLFPQADFTAHPKHRQFMYALLRQAMLPAEAPLVAPEVEAALRQLDEKQILDLVTRVNVFGEAPKIELAGEDGRQKQYHRHMLARKLLEPIFEKFYQDDLENYQPPEPPEGQPGEGQPGEGDPFGHDPLDEAIPDPIDFDKAIKKAKEFKNKQIQQGNEKFEEAIGVKREAFENYQRDYLAVEPHIEALSRVFDEVIARRKSYRRVLRKTVKEGPMLDPRKVATGLAEIMSGRLEPEIMLDFEKKEVIRQQPNRLEFTLVCDGSGSMRDGEKELMQRRLAVLVAEAFAEFRDRIEKERRGGEKIDLSIKSEVRLFANSDQPLKPLSESLTHPERVDMHQALGRLPGGGNNEPATFAAMEKEQFVPETIAALQKGDLKKIIVFLTDGETDEAAIQGWIRRFQELAGENPEGKSNLVIAGIGFEGGVSAKDTYRPNGYYAQTLGETQEIFSNFISQILEDV